MVTESVTIVSRAERLLQLSDLLRGTEGSTVAQLANQLGVSRRTLLRDLASLRDRGMPISSDVGRGGGVRLEGDRGLTALHLSVSEVVAIWLAARLSREASELPWAEAANSGMAKLLASLPKPKSRALRALCRRVIVGRPASANVRAGIGAPPPELLRLFEEAFSAGLGLAFHYTDREQKVSIRRVEPHGLLVETPAWYVLARDIDKAEPRMFRMDRIARARILPDVEFKPDLRVIQAQFADLSGWHPLAGHWLT
ncbi:MAG TPA: WYL domain-containing protein [Polyangiaceae bacterium]|nr:WYL domain-containing protein [Polyangiaceae bacterium]